MPRFMHINKIKIDKRQRTSIERKPLEDLMDSIREDGLLHPIVLFQTDPTDLHRLVAGERRLRAITELHRQGVLVRHDNMDVPKDSIPCTIVKDKDLPALLKLEYVENVIRENIPWQDQCLAMEAIVTARKEADSKTTVRSIAQELQQTQPERSVKAIETQLGQAVQVAQFLQDRPDLQRARSQDEAWRILLKEQIERYEAEVAKRRIASIQMTSRIWDLKHGDLKTHLVERPDGEVDLILVDPPYGVDIHKQKFAPGAHSYDDTQQYSRDLSLFIIQEGWRICKPRANLFMFCSLDSFYWLRDHAKRFGWSTWDRPLIWRKSSNEGASPWGSMGFLLTYEIILFATKGQKGIRGPYVDVIDAQKVAARSREHGAEKPIEVLEKLIELSTSPGDLVIDPCAGSGSTLLAAVRRNRRVVGIELEEKYYNRAMSRMLAYEESQPDPGALPETKDEGVAA